VSDIDNPSNPRELRAQIALIGDLHGHWDAVDEQYFNASNHDLLLFTGDLGSGGRENGVQIARSLVRLAKPALVMPGNNDAPHLPLIASEFAHQRGLVELLQLGAQAAHRSVREAAGEARLCGYSVHPLELGGCGITLIAGRPFAMGGGELSYPERVHEAHGIGTLEHSTQRLCELVDEAPTRDVLFLSHNGPFGLGDDPTDLWGCDFKSEREDWGDRDLAEAIAHAKRQDKRVLAVVAGHMHLHTRQGRPRTSQRIHEDTLYINPARVPRIYAGPVCELRHHAVLDLIFDRVAETLHVDVRDVIVEA